MTSLFSPYLNFNSENPSSHKFNVFKNLAQKARKYFRNKYIFKLDKRCRVWVKYIYLQ